MDWIMRFVLKLIYNSMHQSCLNYRGYSYMTRHLPKVSSCHLKLSMKSNMISFTEVTKQKQVAQRFRHRSDKRSRRFGLQH